VRFMGAMTDWSRLAGRSDGQLVGQLVG